MNLKIFLIPGVLLLGLAGGAAGMFAYSAVFGEDSEANAGHSAVGASGHGTSAESTETVFVPVESMTVNLKDSPQMLYAGLSLAMPSQASADAIKQQMPEVRNRMLLTLSDADPQAIRTAEGKQSIAGQLKNSLPGGIRVAGKPVVIDKVLFNNFVIQ